ncbi:MAG: DUF1570 domain-containing protein [Deltaproteobacteria bacterium]|nr:DUF1570 domain-containing protein [Deltaproteobacteria bacterium]
MSFSRVCVVLAGLVAACGSMRPGGGPAKAQRGPWRELTSEHFTIWTDTSAERARVLVPAMENLRQVVVGVSAFNETKGKILVIAFDSEDEVHEYIPKQFIAFAISGTSVLRQPVIVLAGESLEDDRSVVTHELTHVITYNMIRTQPAWFAEGIAGYFETVRLDEGRANLDIGVPREGRMAELHHDGIEPTAELFACDRHDCEDDRFYATTWALFTFLVNQHPRELTSYMETLASLRLGDKPPDWSAVVPSLPPETLDHELAEWLAYGKIRVSKYNIKLHHDWPVTERPLADADVFAAKGALRYLMASEHAAPPPELDKALAIDPTNVIASLIHAAEAHDVDPELAHRLTAAHPDDWRAWWLAWRAAKTFDESNEARAKTCALVANAVAVPIDECSKPAPTKDTRREVFMAASPQISDCLHFSKYKELAPKFLVDVELDANGAVTSAHAEVGTPKTNTCIEDLMKTLAWPAQHAGTFHMETTTKH